MQKATTENLEKKASEYIICGMFYFSYTSAYIVNAIYQQGKHIAYHAKGILHERRNDSEHTFSYYAII